MKKSKMSYYARKRYSNSDPSSIFETLPGSDEYSELPSDYYSGSSSGSGFNWGGLNQTLNIISSAITGIFSPSSKYTSQMYSEQYKQEKRTNTILWVVIGLMVALGVVLLVRKNN